MTTQCPDNIRIPNDALEWRDYSDYWILYSNAVHHNGERRELKVNLWSLREGQTVGCMVSREGELHVYIDGVDNGIVWTGLPTHKPFWGVADVHARTKKIQLVSGEWLLSIAPLHHLPVFTPSLLSAFCSFSYSQKVLLFIILFKASCPSLNHKSLQQYVIVKIRYHIPKPHLHIKQAVELQKIQTLFFTSRTLASSKKMLTFSKLMLASSKWSFSSSKIMLAFSKTTRKRQLASGKKMVTSNKKTCITSKASLSFSKTTSKRSLTSSMRQGSSSLGWTSNLS